MRRLAATLALLGLLSSALVPAADETLAVIVAATRPDIPDADDVALMFKRRKVFWRDGSRIEPVNLPADHPLRQRFSRRLLKLSPEALEDFWNEQYFHGVLPPHVLASETAVLRFVAQTPSAIGYLSACLLGAEVRPVLLIEPDGRLLAPSDAPALVCG